MPDRRDVPHDEAPDLSFMTTADLVALMGECGQSPEPSDQAFAKACRDEIARRKPEKKHG